MAKDSADKGQPAELPLSKRWIDLRKIALMRAVLALSALLVIYIDRSQPNEFSGPIYLALASYGVYSIVIWVLAVRRSRALPITVLHWLDVAWYLPLIALSNGTNSIFFFFFFFAILVASFGWGFHSGMRVTVVSAVLFTVVGYAAANAQSDFQLNRLLLRPIELLVLGYLIAYWGGVQSRLIARLQLLKEVSILSNPRFGVERTIQSVLESLRSSYGADSCLTILPKSQAGHPIRLYGSSSEVAYHLYRTDRNGSKAGDPSSEISHEMARAFLTASPSHAIIYRRGNPGEVFVYDTKTKDPVNEEEVERPAFLNAFDDKSCFSVPV
ncbi:MAG TPA: hypothetical protein VE056_07535, partial [Pyrinomonadaceae bacterium]|nr:hypothetical protein [Pyrinomonadaceae bacterium]